MAGRPILAFVSLILVAAGILFQFFVILSGSTTSSPEDRVYFLRADTGPHIPGSPATAAWTFFAICNWTGNKVANCGHSKAALPFNPPQNFGTDKGVPLAFQNTHHYYYLSRFMFAFYLIALFFAVCSLFCGLLALCTRIGAYLSGLLVSIATGFQVLTASLMTAWTVQARHHFSQAGFNPHLGSYAYGFTWGAFVAFFLAMVLFCGAGSAGRKNASYETKQSRWGMFGRKRSARNRDGVKDEYS